MADLYQSDKHKMDFVEYARVIPRENLAQAFAHHKARMQSLCSLEVTILPG